MNSRNDLLQDSYPIRWNRIMLIVPVDVFLVFNNRTSQFIVHIYRNVT